MHEQLGEREPELRAEVASFVGERTGLLRWPADDEPAR
jgi:hypothetical protein